MKRYSDKEIIKLCHDVQIGTGGMDQTDALNTVIEWLKGRESPEDAWKRGQEAMRSIIAAGLRLRGNHALAGLTETLDTYDYTPLPYQGKEPGR